MPTQFCFVIWEIVGITCGASTPCWCFCYDRESQTKGENKVCVHKHLTFAVAVMCEGNLRDWESLNRVKSQKFLSADGGKNDTNKHTSPSFPRRLIDEKKSSTEKEKKKMLSLSRIHGEFMLSWGENYSPSCRHPNHKQKRKFSLGW